MNGLGTRAGMSAPALRSEVTPESKAQLRDEPRALPGPRISLQGVLKLAALLAATVRAGALPTPEQPTVQAPQSLADVTGLACVHGACSALVGTSVAHYLYPAECPIIADTLQGISTVDGKADSRKVLLFQSTVDGEDVTFEPAEALRTQRWEKMCYPSDSGKLLAEVLSVHENLTLRFTNFRSPHPPGLPLQPGAAVVGLVNIMAALGRQTSPWELTSPWTPPATVQISAKPMAAYASDILHRMQGLSPTVFVTDRAIFEPNRMGEPVSRAVVLRHFLEQGYFIVETGTTAKQDEWRAVLFLPPTPGIVDTFGAHADRPVHGLMVDRPTRDAIRAFNIRYPRSEPSDPATLSDPSTPSTGDSSSSIAAVVCGISLVGGTALVLSTLGKRRPAQVATPAAHGPQRQPAPREPRVTEPRRRRPDPPVQPSPDSDSKGAATSRRSRLREHAGLAGPEPTEQREFTEPLPRDSKEALHAADALLKGQTWKVQREAWPKLARHIGEALVGGLPTIAVAILWSAYNHSQRDLQELFADKTVDGPALRSIRRSLELSQELHTNSETLLDIRKAVERLDKIMLILNSAGKKPARDDKVNTGQGTKDGKQGAGEAPPGDAEAPRRSAWPFMPPSRTVAHKNAYDAYHHFKREAGKGQITAELREARKEMAVPAFGTYPHLHFGQFGMVYSEKPEGGRPVIFGKGEEFNPAIFDRVYASLPDDERGAEICRVLDNVADYGGAG